LRGKWKSRNNSKVKMTSQKLKVELKGRVYKFSVSVIELMDELSIKRIHYSLIDQLIRSSTSIGANIIEAKSASSKRDFIKYYEISLKSANETKYWLYLFRDALKVNSDKLQALIQEIDELCKIIASCILSLKNK
jgi:four helix bundle protein